MVMIQPVLPGRCRPQIPGNNTSFGALFHSMVVQWSVRHMVHDPRTSRHSENSSPVSQDEALGILRAAIFVARINMATDKVCVSSVDGNRRARSGMP